MPVHRLPAIVLLLLLAACEPVGPIPGTRLSGTTAVPPADWTGLNAVEVVQLEVTGPYVVNVWGVGLRDGYYVVAAEGNDSKWARRIQRDAKVRLRIGDTIYPLVAEIQPRSSLDVVRDAFRAKYDVDDDSDFPDAIVFRLHAR